MLQFLRHTRRHLPLFATGGDEHQIFFPVVEKAEGRFEGAKEESRMISGFLLTPAAALIWSSLEVVLVAPPPLKGKPLERALRTARR
jgi:hypothetical protein